MTINTTGSVTLTFKLVKVIAFQVDKVVLDLEVLTDQIAEPVQVIALFAGLRLTADFQGNVSHFERSGGF